MLFFNQSLQDFIYISLFNIISPVSPVTEKCKHPVRRIILKEIFRKHSHYAAVFAHIKIHLLISGIQRYNISELHVSIFCSVNRICTSERNNKTWSVYAVSSPHSNNNKLLRWSIFILYISVKSFYIIICNKLVESCIFLIHKLICTLVSFYHNVIAVKCNYRTCHIVDSMSEINLIIHTDSLAPSVVHSC